jgi:hypothetical protein
MKTGLTLLFSLLFTAGFSQKPVIYSHFIPGSEKCTLVQSDVNSRTLVHPDYKIILNSNDNVGGEKITVVQTAYNDTIISIQSGPISFYGIYKGFLFIDKGTGVIRELIVYSLKEQNFVVSLRYENAPFLRSDSVFYQYPFKWTDAPPANPPACPDSVKITNPTGYSEKRIFILHNGKSVNTGDFKCEYRE